MPIRPALGSWAKTVPLSLRRNIVDLKVICLITNAFFECTRATVRKMPEPRQSEPARHEGAGNLGRLEARVTGRVQGVGYRYFVRISAADANLRGFVRNEPDGTVLVVAEGRNSDLQRLLEALRRGPRAARVKNVEVEWKPPQEEFVGFAIDY